MLSEWETFPTCPACGCVDQDWWDGLSTNELARDGDSTEWACPPVRAPNDGNNLHGLHVSG